MNWTWVLFLLPWDCFSAAHNTCKNRFQKFNWCIIEVENVCTCVMRIMPIWIYKFFYETIGITFSGVLAVCLCVITLNEIAHKMQMNNSLLLAVGTTVHYQILDLIPLGEVKLYTILEHRNKNLQPRNSCTSVSYLIFNKGFKKRPWFLGQKIQVSSTNDTDPTGWLDVEEWK